MGDLSCNVKCLRKAVLRDLDISWVSSLILVVDSRYLEVQGTLSNTSRLPYLEI